MLLQRVILGFERKEIYETGIQGAMHLFINDGMMFFIGCFLMRCGFKKNTYRGIIMSIEFHDFCEDSSSINELPRRLLSEISSQDLNFIAICRIMHLCAKLSMRLNYKIQLQKKKKIKQRQEQP